MPNIAPHLTVTTTSTPNPRTRGVFAPRTSKVRIECASPEDSAQAMARLLAAHSVRWPANGRCESSHPSAAVALRIDGPSWGVPYHDCYVSEVDYCHVAGITYGLLAVHPHCEGCGVLCRPGDRAAGLCDSCYKAAGYL